ncbi:hypothetical protein [Cellulomonas massiliensis]|uniref:hypothetical protein n=1 Tax=Cellulomonas massiliensis TaxID=1465811 RepID=UPI000303E688|nr:hypothetical protein [Cellulomonas massiliensis]
MTGVSGVGGWPGTDPLEAQGVVVGDLVDTGDVDGLPFTVTLPARGPWATPTGQAVARLVELPAELGPHGWRLADRPGADLARARALRREDLDALAVAAHGYEGPLVVPVLGPVTLAAELYLARGDRAVADAGAVRELAESSAAGLGEHLADLARAVPGARPTVLVLESLVGQVVAGVLPSFSGYRPLRAVAAPVVGERVAALVRGAREGGAERVVVHVGSTATAVPLARSAGADAVAVEVEALGEAGWERVAEAVEGGLRLWAQVPVQATSQCAGPDVRGQADTVLRPWRALGLPARGLDDVVLLVDPAGSGPDDARGALAGAVRAARLLAEHAQS